MYGLLTQFPPRYGLSGAWVRRGSRHRAPCLDLQVPLHDNGTRKMVARGVIVIDSSHRSHLHR